MEFNVRVQTYNSHGGHRTLSLIPELLLRGSADFGSALTDITVTLHFPASRSPRSSLENLFQNHRKYMQLLPKVVFQRKRAKASIDVASELLDASDSKIFERLSVELLADGAREVVAALTLLSGRIKSSDAFDLPALIAHCADYPSAIPKTEEQLQAFAQHCQAQRKVGAAARSPWDKLEIDWSKYHREARAMLDDPFFWDCVDEFAPHGNDTGADLLIDFERWTRKHPSDDPMSFLQRLLTRWGFADGEHQNAIDEAAVALAFAEIKCRGSCTATVRDLTLAAMQRQRDAALAATTWPHREDRLKRLDMLAAKLTSIRIASGESST
jgi:uncharacterized protein YfeS